MARQVFQGGTSKGYVSDPVPTSSPIPTGVNRQLRKGIRERGISTSLYQERQTNARKNSSYWVFAAGGTV